MSTRPGQRPPPPAGDSYRGWAEQLVDYLTRTRSQLVGRMPDAAAAQDGVLLWDPDGYPVVAHGGRYRQLVVADGYASLARSADATAAAADTPYAIEFDTPAVCDDCLQLGTPPSRLMFADPGVYKLSFTAQIESTAASSVDFYFWPRINGADLPGSTMRAALHVNGDTHVASRSALFEVSAGDYLEAMWAVSATSGRLRAHPATAFCPAAPAATLLAWRLRQ